MKWLIILLNLMSIEAQSANGMNPFSGQFTARPGTEIRVANMPRVRTQDSLGICYSMTASVLFDHANCVTNRVADCSQLPDSQRASPLDMARYSREAPEGSKGRRTAYTAGIPDGGIGFFSLNNVIKTRYVASEACVPFTQVVAENGNPDVAERLAAAQIQRLRNAYEAYKKDRCERCALTQIATTGDSGPPENFNIRASNEEILKAFSQDTFGQALGQLLIPAQCDSRRNQVHLNGRWQVSGFPDIGENKSNYETALSKIKEQLSNGRPVALSFCAQERRTVNSLAACAQLTNAQGQRAGQGHEVVIKGYRRVCNSRGVCRDAVQVQNSWGEGWQRANADGWVDAKELLDRTFYEPLSISWLEPLS